MHLLKELGIMEPIYKMTISQLEREIEFWNDSLKGESQSGLTAATVKYIVDECIRVRNNRILQRSIGETLNLNLD